MLLKAGGGRRGRRGREGGVREMHKERKDRKDRGGEEETARNGRGAPPTAPKHGSRMGR